jgi:hypothetical protein
MANTQRSVEGTWSASILGPSLTTGDEATYSFCRQSRAVARSSGSITRIRRRSLRNQASSWVPNMDSSGGARRTKSAFSWGRAPSSRWDPFESNASRTSRLFFARRNIRPGKGPTTCSISPRCSTLSCVGKRSSPWYSSARMQPTTTKMKTTGKARNGEHVKRQIMDTYRHHQWRRKTHIPQGDTVLLLPADHMSDGMLHPQPRMTSGARYCRVLTIDDFFSLS